MWNYLLESYRNKKNRPLSFFVNWLGLTLGLTAVIVIYLYVMQEMRHDRGMFDDPMTDVYRLENNDMGAIVPSGLNAELSQLAEVETSARVLVGGYTASAVDNVNQNMAAFKMLFVDTTFFRVFPYKFIAGAAESALESSNNVVVTRSTAQKLFSTLDVIGKVVNVNNQVNLQITGVIEDIPENAIFSPDMIMTARALYDKLWGSSFEWTNSSWGHWNAENYVRLKPGASGADFEKKLCNFTTAKFNETWRPDHGIVFSTRSFNDIYLSGGEDNTMYSHAKMIDQEPIKVMSLIALLVLVIAIINYVNIYTARSTEVIRAMGIKSIMGARRVQLIGFVIFDSVVITFLSAISAFILAWCLEPFYIDIIGSNVSLAMSWDLPLMIFVAIPLICGIISGIFPAIALTRMKPLDAMANRSSGNRAMGYVRNGLIVFQFIISIALIGTTLFINKQMEYISAMNMGYDRENVLIINGKNFLGDKYSVLRGKLLENPNIMHVSASKSSPVNVDEFQTFTWGETPEESYSPNIMHVDGYTFDLLGLELLEGEMLKFSRTERDKSVLINEAMAKLIRATNPDITFPFKNFKGVFKDFHASSVKEPVKPLVIDDLGGASYFDAFVKINGKDFENTMKFVEKTFKELYPNQLYSIRFMDDDFNKLYQSDRLFRARLLTFSILAIFISCLGLFALVSYSIERRRKEIALRKVYGSTITQVLILLINSFLRWLLVAFVIAVPLVYYISSRWIEQFQYRIEMSWWIYAIALFVTLFIAITTVIGQAYKAATENPAKNVKAE